MAITKGSRLTAGERQKLGAKLERDYGKVESSEVVGEAATR